MRKRSTYRPRPVIKPLGIKDEVVLEPHTRISALALDTDWIETQHLRDIGSHALLCQLVAATMGSADKATTADAMIEILVAVEDRYQEDRYQEDRYQRDGVAAVPAQDMQILRAGLADTLPWLCMQPNMAVYRASERLVRKHDRLRDAARRQVAA